MTDGLLSCIRDSIESNDFFEEWLIGLSLGFSGPLDQDSSKIPSSVINVDFSRRSKSRFSVTTDSIFTIKTSNKTRRLPEQNPKKLLEYLHRNLYCTKKFKNPPKADFPRLSKLISP